MLTVPQSISSRSMNSPPTRSAWRYEQMLRIALAGWLLLCLAFFVIRTLHWREVNDPAQITYLAFLMDHGFTPYKYLLEMNMPGIYLVNWSVMHLLGPGSLAWRVFDLSLVAAGIVAMLFIARTYDWVGGLFAGILFALFHGHDGPAEQGQRDFIIAILLACAYAFLFEAVRRQRYWLLFFFGACAGAAATIKPPALVFALFLITVVCWRLRAQPRALLQAAAYSVAGMLLPLAIVFVFLLQKGAVHAFFEISHILLPYYATLGRRPLGFLIARSFTTSIAMLLWLRCCHGPAAMARMELGAQTCTGGYRIWRVLRVCPGQRLALPSIPHGDLHSSLGGDRSLRCPAAQGYCTYACMHLPAIRRGGGSAVCEERPCIANGMKHSTSR